MLSAGVQDIQYLASQQFKAKSSELANLTPVQLINGDQKVLKKNKLLCDEYLNILHTSIEN